MDPISLGLAGIGAGINLYNSYKANKRAEKAQRQQEALQREQLALSRQFMNSQIEEAEYRREMERLNRATLEAEREYAKDEIADYKQQLQNERLDVKERQSLLDRIAARERQFELDQLVRNQGIAAEERQQYLAEAEQIKAQLQSERQYDIARQGMLDLDAKQQQAFQLQQILRNQNLSTQERQFAEAQLLQLQQQLSGERGYALDRQLAADRDAAAQQAFRLEQLLQNQNLAASEREYAQAQLAQAQRIASGEADADLQRYYQEQQQARSERQFGMGAYEGALGQAQSERSLDLQLRDDILSQVGGLQSALRETQASLGGIDPARQFSPDELRAEIERRTRQYQTDIDRAADRVASQSEADLIRRNMDRSTLGTQTRADLASRLADEYQSARDKAYDEALAYISGKQGLNQQDFNNQLTHRQAALGETQSIEGAGLDALLNMPRAQSAVDAYNLASIVPSAVYARGLQSANNYGAPVGINSAMVSGDIGGALAGYINPNSAATAAGLGLQSGMYEGVLGSSMGQTLNPTSAASNVGLGAPSAIYDQRISSGIGPTLGLPSAAAYQLPPSAVMNPYALDLPNGQSMYGSAMSGANGNYNVAMQSAAGAGAAVGQSFKNLGSQLNDWWQERNKTNEAPSGGGGYSGTRGSYQPVVSRPYGLSN